MWRPAILRPRFAASLRQSPICSCQMPCFECSPPVFVFWLWPWPKPGLTRRVISRPGARSPNWAIMSGEPQFTWMPFSTTRSSDLAVEDVGRVDDRRRIAGGRIAGRHRPADFARAHRVDQHALPSNQIEHGQIRIGFLGVSDRVERPQVIDPLLDHRGFIHESRRPEPAGDFGDGHTGDLRAYVGERGGGGGRRHASSFLIRMETSEPRPGTRATLCVSEENDSTGHAADNPPAGDAPAYRRSRLGAERPGTDLFPWTRTVNVHSLP